MQIRHFRKAKKHEHGKEVGFGGWFDLAGGRDGAATDDFSQDNQKAGIVKYDNWEINVAKAVFCRLQRGYKTVRRVIPLESRERSESCQLR